MRHGDKNSHCTISSLVLRHLFRYSENAAKHSGSFAICQYCNRTQDACLSIISFTIWHLASSMRNCVAKLLRGDRIITANSVPLTAISIIIIIASWIYSYFPLFPHSCFLPTSDVRLSLHLGLIIIFHSHCDTNNIVRLSADRNTGATSPASTIVAVVSPPSSAASVWWGRWLHMGHF